MIRPSAGYDWLSRRLLGVVALLGVAVYGCSFGPVFNGAGATGWDVRFATLAALCAATSLLPKRKLATFATALAATLGLLEAISSALIPNSHAVSHNLDGVVEPGWALTAIVVLNALQAAAAIAAYLLSPDVGADTSTATGYQGYVDYYNEALRQYYEQQAPIPPPDTTRHSDYGQASGTAQGRPTRQWASQHGDYAELISPQSQSALSTPTSASSAGAGTPTPQFGMPSSGPLHVPADQPETDHHVQRPPTV